MKTSFINDSGLNRNILALCFSTGIKKNNPKDGLLLEGGQGHGRDTDVSKVLRKSSSQVGAGGGYCLAL